MSETYRESNHPALYYQDMLSDSRRMERYREAIGSVVKPGDIVADLGTGLGVLAIMAAQAGAAKVYAVDVRPYLMPITQAVIDANGFSDRILLVEGDATTVALPEQVDVIINELIGDFGTDENIYECVAAVAQCSLRDGGRVLPRRLSTHIVGVTYAGEFRGVYAKDSHGMDISAALDVPFLPGAVMYGLRNKPTELTNVASVEIIDFEGDMPGRPLEHHVELPIVQPGELQGFVGFFRSELAPGIELDNYPCYPGCHWVNWNWPVTPAQRVEPGMLLRGTLVTPAKTVASCWNWSWEIEGNPGPGA